MKPKRRKLTFASGTGAGSKSTSARSGTGSDGGGKTICGIHGMRAKKSGAQPGPTVIMALTSPCTSPCTLRPKALLCRFQTPLWQPVPPSLRKGNLAGLTHSPNRWHPRQPSAPNRDGPWWTAWIARHASKVSDRFPTS